MSSGQISWKGAADSTSIGYKKTRAPDEEEGILVHRLLIREWI
jgi:hypothetical protein